MAFATLSERNIRTTFKDGSGDAKGKPCKTWTAPMVLAFLFLLALCFQDFSSIGIETGAVKPYHLVMFVVLIYSLFTLKMKWMLPGKWFFIGLLALLIISFFDYLAYGFNAASWHYVFMYMIATCFYNLGHDFTVVQWKRVAQTVAIVMMGLVFLKLVFYYDRIIYFLANQYMGHPWLPTFFLGGVNIESSWLAMFCVFFDSDRRGKAYFLSAITLSMIYASRASLIICVLAFVYIFVLKNGMRGVSLRMFLAVACIVCAFIVLAANGNIVIERLLEAGQDDGSLGRLRMWDFAIPTFLDAPLFGAGAGNAINHVSLISGLIYAEDNVHMYFLQVLLDFGITGFLIFIAMVCYFLNRCFLDKLVSPFEAFILIFLIVSFIQFGGGDVLVGFALGGLFALWQCDERKEVCNIEIDNDQLMEAAA